MEIAPPGSDAVLSPPARPRRSWFGLIGFVAAVLGLPLAIASPYIAEFLKPPPAPHKLSDTLAEAGDKLVGRLIDRVRGRKPDAPVIPPAERPWLLYLTITATSLGLIGSLAGTVGWIRREDHRLAGSAIAVGALAVAWMYIVAALVIALVLIFFLWLSGNM